MKTLVSVMGQPCRFERALATNVSHPKTDALCRNKLSVGPLAVIDAPENETALDFRTGDLSGSGKYQKGVRSIVLRAAPNRFRHLVIQPRVLSEILQVIMSPSGELG